MHICSRSFSQNTVCSKQFETLRNKSGFLFLCQTDRSFLFFEKEKHKTTKLTSILPAETRGSNLNANSTQSDLLIFPNASHVSHTEVLVICPFSPHSRKELSVCEKDDASVAPSGTLLYCSALSR